MCLFVLWLFLVVRMVFGWVLVRFIWYLWLLCFLFGFRWFYEVGFVFGVGIEVILGFGVLF